MVEPEATVLAVRAGFARVRVQAPVACARCATGRGCGAGLGASPRPRELEVRLAPGPAPEPGDTVRLALEPALLLRAALVAYGLPLAGLAAAVAAAGAAGGSDLLQVCLGAAGLAAGIALGRTAVARDARLCGLAPVATRCAGPGSAARGRRR